MRISSNGPHRSSWEGVIGMSDGGAVAGKHMLDRLRESTYDIVDVTTPVASDEFFNFSTGRHLTSGLLFETRFSSARFDRTPRHIARGGFDHYQVVMYLDGNTEFTAGRRVARLRPGDVVLIDVAQPNRTDLAAGPSGAVHGLALMLPRMLLAPLLGAPDSVSASLFSRDLPAGRLIGERLLSLRREGARLGVDVAAAAAAVDGIAGLVAQAVGPARQADFAVARASRQALLGAIKAYIEKNLLSESLAVPALCRRFGLSRATLYRLFEPEGGFTRYVQERRLHRAFMRLISPTDRPARMIDLAVDHHFSSDNTFIRAFRRHYGLTPGEARELAIGRARADDHVATAGGSTFEADSLAWIASLTSR
jgi:AraC-like DNA-binding protein